MAGEETMIVAGIGCRRGALSEEVVSLVHAALASFGIEHEELDAIATETSKANEGGIEDAARRLSVPLIRCPIEKLGDVASEVMTHSSRVQALKGVPSIAEASALVAAGRNARLLGARIATDNVTCAIAIGDDS
jgi:cobalt-precorrin 5A hydrolase